MRGLIVDEIPPQIAIGKILSSVNVVNRTQVIRILRVIVVYILVVP